MLATAAACASAPQPLPPPLPSVNAWRACEVFCAPYRPAMAQMDSGEHLGCLCAIPAKRFESQQPEG